ncbi:calcium/sodium antiporter [Gammaproteobacteria bacterium]|jgi:cation:H+ antiporter|nr:calcium/sodium antiporter [Gammaproteobacteria bacterium]MDB9859692.1 calcium/sodium antiporter [Gammaproteobacteria bacterium]MDB9939921.1 calcium/sodium antiporter [Gammaproteobacteria bacterium]
MELATNIFLLLLGISILVWGANKFVDHASVIAKHMGISDLVIGLTLIAFGTSAPEIFVGISSIINQNEEIALGTAIGSNISNIALIFGVSCLYLTGSSKTQLWNLMPFGLSVALLGLTLADGVISVNESLGFVGIFMIFMFVLFKTDGLAEEDSSGSNEFGRSLFISLIGLVALVAGANIAVIYAENTALLLGVPKLIIGLTIIALGTSLPELAATIVALRKGKHQMVVGNIIGSNVFNLVFIIPMIGFFGSVELSPMVMQRDFYILLALSIAFILLAVVLTKLQFRKNVFSISGVILIASYILYISALSGIV